MSDKCECPVRKALETALERIPTHAIRKVSSEFWEGGGSIVYHDWYLDLRAVLANCCHCAIVPDEVEHTFRELRTEYAELRENIDGWTKQCRTLEPLVANRDGESIIGAAAKEIEQLRAENAKWLKLLQARTLEKERISDENERLTNENIDLRLRLNDRILRGDAKAK